MHCSCGCSELTIHVILHTSVAATAPRSKESRAPDVRKPRYSQTQLSFGRESTARNNNNDTRANSRVDVGDDDENDYSNDDNADIDAEDSDCYVD